MHFPGSALSHHLFSLCDRFSITHGGWMVRGKIFCPSNEPIVLTQVSGGVMWSEQNETSVLRPSVCGGGLMQQQRLALVLRSGAGTQWD